MGTEGHRQATVIGGAGTDAPDIMPCAGVVSFPVLGRVGAHITPGWTSGANPHHHQRAATARGWEGPVAMVVMSDRRS